MRTPCQRSAKQNDASSFVDIAVENKNATQLLSHPCTLPRPFAALAQTATTSEVPCFMLPQLAMTWCQQREKLEISVLRGRCAAWKT